MSLSVVKVNPKGPEPKVDPQVIRRLNALVRYRQLCAKNCALTYMSGGAMYAQWLVAQKNTEKELHALIPEVFKFLIELRQEINR